MESDPLTSLWVVSCTLRNQHSDRKHNLHLSDCDFCFSGFLLFSQQLVFIKANITKFQGEGRLL